LKHKKEKKKRKFSNSWRSGADLSDGCAMAQEAWSLAQDPQVAVQWRRREKKVYKFDFLSQLGLQKFDGKELFL
jgi:hypothetical protein